MPNKKFLIVIILVALVAGLLLYLLGREDADSDGQLTLYGNIDLREVALSFMVQDRIVEETVDEGSLVKRGQLLARLDPVRFESAVGQLKGELEQAQQKLAALVNGTRPQEIKKARADVAAAEANVVEAQTTYERKLRLAKSSAASQQDVDDALGQLGVTRAALNAANETLSLRLEGPRQEDIAASRGAVQSLQAALVKAEKDLADTRLLAPADGVIRSRILEPGDIGGPTRPVYTLAKMEPVWIRTYLPETDLGRVSEGMAASISSDSFPGKRYPAWVGFISPSAEFTPKNVETPALRTRLVYQVWVYACNPSRELRLGMPATVVIDLNARPGEGVQPDCALPGAAPLPTAEQPAAPAAPAVTQP